MSTIISVVTDEEREAQPFAAMVLDGDYVCRVLDGGTEVFDCKDYLAVIPPSCIVRGTAEVRAMPDKQWSWCHRPLLKFYF